jgi:hypothetical protein
MTVLFPLAIMADVLHTRLFLYQDRMFPSCLLLLDLTKGKTYEAPLYPLLSSLLLRVVVVGRNKVKTSCKPVGCCAGRW